MFQVFSLFLEYWIHLYIMVKERSRRRWKLVNSVDGSSNWPKMARLVGWPVTVALSVESVQMATLFDKAAPCDQSYVV